MINHMATVVRITKEDSGNVTGWDMYHGQNPKKGSGMTSHRWHWPATYTSNCQKYPPGGYWDQRIVGITENLIPHTWLSTKFRALTLPILTTIGSGSGSKAPLLWSSCIHINLCNFSIAEYGQLSDTRDPSNLRLIWTYYKIFRQCSDHLNKSPLEFPWHFLVSVIFKF